MAGTICPCINDRALGLIHKRQWHESRLQLLANRITVACACLGKSRIMDIQVSFAPGDITKQQIAMLVHFLTVRIR
jgi:hypothetical protein